MLKKNELKIENIKKCNNTSFIFEIFLHETIYLLGTHCPRTYKKLCNLYFNSVPN